MSIVVIETSPRALLESALKLQWTLNLMETTEEGDEVPPAHTKQRGPGFVLKEVERVLQQVRTDLDAEADENTKKQPLMVRLRHHIDAISGVLTGNSVAFAQPDTTTLHELIESLTVLNQSVCTKQSRSNCTIQ